MDKLVNTETLGTRPVTRVTTGRVTDPNTKLSHLKDVKVTVDEVQPILTDEEAMTLEGAEWKPTKKAFKEYGKYMCMANGRRFFAGINPNDKRTMKKKKNETD
jgi:hypothetical protein